MNHKELAKKFLEISHDFKLGDLPTEGQHPKTIGLSQWSKSNLPLALDNIKQIEQEVLEVLKAKFGELNSLKQEIRDTFETGGRVFLCGCGATGRLSLCLETIWKKTQKSKESVLSFMAGGDVALIHSIENFEDFPQYGSRQLLELGFGENDLLISTTEGGETPFVIGATEQAAQTSKRRPYFLYCNPDDILSSVALRSKKVIENKNIEKINLTVSQMVLAGSTRMQASTILMLAAGIGLFNLDEMWLNNLSENIDNLNFHDLEDFIIEESKIYQSGDSVLYLSCDELAISVLTDTTERSPTFSLISFENMQSRTSDYSLCYLSLKSSSSIDEAWSKLLERPPRCLEWSETKEQTSLSRLKGFNISNGLFNQRADYINGKDQLFEIEFLQDGFHFKLNELSKDWRFNSTDLLAKHVLLKVLLNTHSTLVMGRLDRYSSNIMTWVRPSNNKLIDRTIRYVQILLKEKGISKEYDEICYELFKQLESASRSEALVLKVYNAILES
ncbi:hypothetical protein [Halobacteriovorax sp. HLS]|uniref:hypothetical protein n=1 Tax=Halobacteriovorax sp. HLS TaxID=2234000 RepID=UPI000FD9BFF5|nr:hypothetical protein [Halobacteriovorax sp. HLS]